MKEGTAWINFPDAVVEKGTLFLLIFTPLAFGTVQQWSVSIMEMSAFSIFCLTLLKRNIVIQRNKRLSYALISFLALTIIVLFQMLPLPDSLLTLFSPSSFWTYKKFGDGGAFHTISVDPYATRQELLKLLSYAAVFFVVAGTFRTRAQLKTLAITIVCIGFFLAFFSIIQKILWNGRIYWFYPVEETLRGGGSIWAPYINRNHFAGYMEMAIPVGLGLLTYFSPEVKAVRGEPAARTITRLLKDHNLLPSTLLFLAVLIMSASLFTTLSRGGIAAFAVSSLFFAWTIRCRRSLRKKNLLLALFAVAVVVLVALSPLERMEQRLSNIAKEGGFFDRLKIWEDSVHIVSDFPVFGSGLGTFESVYMRYQTKGPLLLFDHAITITSKF